MSDADDRDHPFDPLSMVEIAEEAYNEFEAKRDNASDLQRRYAILAILSGTPPEEVAHACGFGKVRAGPGFDANRAVRQMLGIEPPTPNDMQRFAQWLGKWLYDQIVTEQPQSRIQFGTTYLEPPGEDDDD